jgi:hypothetical protein
MEKGKFTFTKESALQEVGNLIESFKEMKIVNLGNDTYSVFGVLDTSIEQEIQNAITKAGKLLYCDKIELYDLQETELYFEGELRMYYKNEKHIDEHKRIQEQLRLHDMLRMAFDGVFQWVEFTDFIMPTYDDEHIIVRIPFELGKIRNKD